MKTVQDFINDFVKIEIIESSQSYGHYPFQLLGIKENGQMDIGALLLGGDISAVYAAAKQFIRNGNKKVFLSVDFPAGLDIEHDFVAVYTFENGKTEAILLPYDSETGEQFEPVTTGTMLNMVIEQFERIKNL